MVQYVWGLLGPVARVDLQNGSNTRYYVLDARGHARALVDSTGSVTDYYEYDAWGNVLPGSYGSAPGAMCCRGLLAPRLGQCFAGEFRLGAWGNVLPGSFGSTPFKWNAAGGYQHVPFTGLYHVDAREYDPRTARWLQRDPIGIASGDPNLYRYCGNDAVNLNDPSGLQPPTEFVEIGKISFSQASIGAVFGDGDSNPLRNKPLSFLVEKITAGSTEFKVQVVMRNGVLYALNNRTLFSYHQAGVAKVPILRLEDSGVAQKSLSNKLAEAAKEGKTGFIKSPRARNAAASGLKAFTALGALTAVATTAEACTSSVPGRGGRVGESIGAAVAGVGFAKAGLAVGTGFGRLAGSVGGSVFGPVGVLVFGLGGGYIGGKIGGWIGGFFD